ncbi:hypothetical protein [Caballeronia sp.]|jgi:hypothetical protein|uniref:hypothetical protein n=1 Tax=Caballeronia sp. TaxID=1931223 RepID=UPI002618BA09|nr:hypothetical protein [Caballeronia sp.]
MTVDQVDLAALEAVQSRLHHDPPRALTAEHREFLASLVRLEPDWSLMPYDHLRDLPAIRWKIENLGKLRTRDAARFAHQGALLAEGFAPPDCASSIPGTRHNPEIGITAVMPLAI